MELPQLTVGLTVYDDYDGAFFTLNSLRLNQTTYDLQIIVVDQNPSSSYGKLLKEFVLRIGGKYVPQTNLTGPSHGRNLCVEHAETAWVLLMDSHILLTPDALNHLSIAIETGQVLPTDLIHGPLIYDDLSTLSSHWNPVWSNDAFGQWTMDERARHPFAPPFEIPMSGVCLMVFHQEHWPTYNKGFKGFGAEEWYIHRKYRKQGGRVLCVPGLRWLHRFGRMPHCNYTLTIENKIFNTLLGDLELDDQEQYVTDIQHWREFNPAATERAVTMLNAYQTEKENYGKQD